MEMNKLWLKCIYLMAICCVAVVCGVNTNATEKETQGVDTVNDVLSIYNKAQVEDLREIQENYVELQREYEQALQNAEGAEVHNGIVMEAEKWCRSERQRIDDEVDRILAENKVISDSVESHFYDSWVVLKNYDLEYKTNVNRVEGLLDKKSRYYVAASRIVDYEQLDEMGREIAVLSQKYSETTDVKVLGDVYNVRYPLGRDTVVTSGFGDRIDPITGDRVSFHSGIDLRAVMGTPVLSVFNGVVADTGFGALGGYYVSIDHGGGLRSYYCHLSDITCEKGQKVSQYDQIALSGNTGSRTTGPHLHFGFYINGNPVDPGILIK